MEMFLNHPSFVHFAVALPVVVVLFQLIYMATKNKAYETSTLVLLFLATISVVMAMYTGNIVGPDVYPLLNKEAQHALLEHKQNGLYIAIFFAVTLVLKISLKKWQNLLAVLLILGALGVLYQGKLGGELVYKHAVGVEVH